MTDGDATILCAECEGTGSWSVDVDDVERGGPCYTCRGAGRFFPLTDDEILEERIKLNRRPMGDIGKESYRTDARFMATIKDREAGQRHLVARIHELSAENDARKKRAAAVADSYHACGVAAELLSFVADVAEGAVFKEEECESCARATALAEQLEEVRAELAESEETRLAYTEIIVNMGKELVALTKLVRKVRE